MDEIEMIIDWSFKILLFALQKFWFFSVLFAFNKIIIKVWLKEGMFLEAKNFHKLPKKTTFLDALFLDVRLLPHYTETTNEWI